MGSNLILKNSGGSELAITHSDSKSGKTIVGTDIVTSVATINDFPTAGIQDGDTVIVKDVDRGGVFIYDGSLAPFTNQGTNFSGWIRQYNGAVNVKWFGAGTAAVQAAIDVAYSNKLIFNNEVYNFTSGFNISSSIEIDLGGSTLNFNTTDYSSGFTIGSDNVYIHSGEINVADADTLYTGQGGASGACVSTGIQSTGVGYKGMKLEGLKLSWNRTDGNGGAISILGSTNNAIINNISIKSNSALVGNAIGVEWGGTPIDGTGHPHNILISNITVGDLDGQIDDRFIVWLSGTFNIDIKNIVCNSCAGGVMVTAGDNGNEYAPEEYKHSIGSNISIDNMTLNSFRKNGIRVVGDATPTGTPLSNNTSISNSTIKADTSATAPAGILVEYSNGVLINNVKVYDSYFGINLNVNCVGARVTDSEVTGSRYSGITVGSISGYTADNIINHCKLSMNTKLSGSIANGGILVANATNTTINNCTFGDIGTTETTNYQITVGANVKKLNLNNNYINNIASGGIGIYTGASSDTDVLPNGSGNYGEAGFTLFGGLPIRQIDGNGNIVFRSTIAPVSGTYKAGDRVIRSPYISGSPKGWMCTVGGTPGTWVADAVL